jgi:ABC-type lipoprotein export system ATPase subunit
VYQLTDVTKTFRKGNESVTALRDVSLEIGDGEWLAIQGRTGHGKTTLLYILGGLWLRRREATRGDPGRDQRTRPAGGTALSAPAGSVVRSG